MSKYERMYYKISGNINKIKSKRSTWTKDTMDAALKKLDKGCSQCKVTKVKFLMFGNIKLTQLRYKYLICGKSYNHNGKVYITKTKIVNKVNVLQMKTPIEGKKKARVFENLSALSIGNNSM